MQQDLIRRYGMLPSAGLVLCAVSGGRDSMCLLTWLQELSGSYGFTVAAAHYHHGLRGQTADRDEQFVRSYCAQHAIPCYVGRGDTNAAVREHGWSVEEAARNLRYAFLLETAQKSGAVRIATAHHMGDNAETVLMNLVRGTGLTGLSGIAPVRGIYIRPLLETSRAEIEEYLAAHAVPYVDDETNEEGIYTRNKVRHEIMPLLAELNPNVVESISKTAALLRQEDEYLDRVTERVCKTVDCDASTARIRREALNDLPLALRRRVVRRMMDQLHIAKKDITARHIRDIVHLAQESGPTAQLSLPRGIVAKNEYDDFCLMAPRCDSWVCMALPPVGEITVGPWCIQCRVVRGAAEEKANRLILDNDAIDAPLFADRWRRGGSMALPGSEGGRSLKRLFVDARIDVAQREETPVIYMGSRPIAVLGVGVDRAFNGSGRENKYILDFYKR